MFNLWADIQNYFKDWLQKTGGVGAYTTFVIDLSEVHSEQLYQFSGDQIIIVKSESTAYIKLNDKRNENIDTTRINQINTPFNEFYITNDASTGSLEILVGTEGVFNSIPARINAVITDPEDAYGRIHQMGNAELAARLGALSSWDRRGDVFWNEDFEAATMHWTKSGNGTGWDVALSTAEALSKEQSVKITSGSDGLEHAQMERILSLPIVGRLGVELSYFIESDVKELVLEFEVWKDGDRYIGRIAADVANSRFQYYNSAGGWTTILTPFAWWHSRGAFHKIKLVCDYENNKYMRFIADDREIDMSNIEMYKDSPGDTNGLKITIWQYSTTGNNGISYIDNIIATMNET